jgi:hypothetical protein
MEAGQLRIHRAGGFSDRARAYRILVDGERAGEIRAKATSVISLPAGEHTVQLKIDWGTSRELTVRVSPDEPIDLHCRGRNPLLALYRITFGRREYVVLEQEGEPAAPQAPHPSVNR